MSERERVLLIAQHVGAEVEMQNYVLSALQRVGCTTEVFDFQSTRLVPTWLKRLVPRRLKSRLSPRRWPTVEQADARLADHALLAACQRFQPTLVLFLRGERISARAIEALRRQGSVVVNWIGDEIRLLFNDALAYGAFTAAFDAWFVADPDYGAQLVNPRHVELLSVACDPAVHRPVSLTPAERQHWSSRVCFVGGHAPEREPFLAAIADLGLAIWGPRWERTTHPRVRACVRMSRQLLPEEWTKAYAATDIVLNVHREFAYAGPNMKCFEALACGAFLLSDWRPEIERLFGGRVPTFRTPEELRQRCQHYLANAAARDAHRQTLRALVISQHTYVHRIRTILETVEQVRAQPCR